MPADTVSVTRPVTAGADTHFAAAASHVWFLLPLDARQAVPFSDTIGVEPERSA